jgi:16S rRNA (guanine1207-N2)-methyltransferase
VTVSAFVYGRPPLDLAAPPVGAVQVSPLIPGSAALESLADAAAEAGLVHAPAGSIERRYVLAQALRGLRPGGALIALAPKDRGGARLRRELEGFGCAVAESARRHHRICVVDRPAEPQGLHAAIAEGAPRLVQATGFWSQPGVFQWDRIDPGTALLSTRLGGLAGRGADLGCGVGVLGRTLLADAQVSGLVGVDVDRRAVECARRNLDQDPRAEFLWADARTAELGADLDFVVSNPPFHTGGREDRTLGQAFVRRAAALLRKGGVMRLVANRHLPYEATLTEAFGRFSVLAEADGYKVLEARR